MKTCSKCGVKKALKLFYKHPKMKDGYKNSCIECVKEYSKVRLSELYLIPWWVNKERSRVRGNYHKLRLN